MTGLETEIKFVSVDAERFSQAARFVKEAVENGAHFGNAEKDLVWERKVDITLTYYFGKYEGVGNNRSLSAEEVGRLFPGQNGSLAKQRVWQILNEIVPKLHQQCPPDIQNRYSLEALKKQLAKPAFLTLPKGPGSSRNIAEDVDNGMGYTGLRERYSSDSLSYARKLLGPFGVDVPYEENRQQSLLQTRQFIQQLAKVGPDTDTKIIRNLLQQVTWSFYPHHRDIFNRYFIALSKFLVSLGFCIDPKARDLAVFTGKLDQLDIPFGQFLNEVKSGSQKGKHRYYFVMRIQTEQIRGVLLSDPALAGFLKSKVS